MPGDGYPGVTAVGTGQRQPRGVQARVVPGDAEAAHTAGAVPAVDDTLATPLLQRPLDLVADVAAALDAAPTA